MIAELLQRNFVQEQRAEAIASLRAFASALEARDPVAVASAVRLAELWKSEVTPGLLRQCADHLQAEGEVEVRAAATAPPTTPAGAPDGVEDEEEDEELGNAYIPSAPLTCLLQTHLETEAERHHMVDVPNEGRGLGEEEQSEVALTSRSLKAGPTPAKRGLESMEDGLDAGYLTHGAYALAYQKLYGGRRPFNPSPAQTAQLGEEALVWLFGDWGSGVDRAQSLARELSRALADHAQPGRTQHLVHLGDTYYVGWPEEYEKRFLPYWPNLLPPGQGLAATNWSLNGNHDMYSGGWGYFDTLLANDAFASHRDAHGQPSSFFLLENSRWQIFGLDSAYFAPDLRGMSGDIDDSQLKFLQEKMNPQKGVILLTHHEMLSVPPTGHESSVIRDQLMKAKLWDSVSACLWGHEHRGAIFDPAYTSAAPFHTPYAVCLGNGGVPIKMKPQPAGGPFDPGIAWEYRSTFKKGWSHYARFGFASLEFSTAQHPDEVVIRFHCDPHSANWQPLHQSSFKS